jgi:hypothetical protein
MDLEVGHDFDNAGSSFRYAEQFVDGAGRRDVLACAETMCDQVDEVRAPAPLSVSA